jgi:hypothetical protein
MASNLVDLIKILIELKDVEPDPNLKDGEVYNSDGRIVTL